MRTASRQGHWQKIHLSIYITLHLCASKHRNLWEFGSIKTKIQFLEWWEGVAWVMGWQGHSDDHFNTAGALLNYWFCTSVHRGFYGVFVVTLMKYNKQAQFQLPFHIALIWFCITSQSSFVCKFHQQTINLYCIWWYQKKTLKWVTPAYQLTICTIPCLFFQHPFSVARKNGV